jgi:uncharacterized surface protein with fasciclin (FAS1) repeats
MKKLLRILTAGVFSLFIFSSCQKEAQISSTSPETNDVQAKAAAELAIDKAKTEMSGFQNQFSEMSKSVQARQSRNIVEIASSYSIFRSLVAAVVKTNLVGVLSDPNLNATVFAPTDAAFAKLPAPFNNAANISAIADQAQIDALKNILLYHALGAPVLSSQIATGRSSATTLKPAGSSVDNVIYLSNTFGIIVVNGKSLVLAPNVKASNGVIHVIDDVMLPPSQTIAEIAIGNPAFSSLVAALVKTNLASVFTGSGDFSVFAPTDAAFAQLPAPFNSAANISGITDQAQIDALANILKYHVTGSRYFAWDLGFGSRIATLAAGTNNKLIGYLGLDRGYVKGNQNILFSVINPANILATNGVIHVIDKVLLP